MEIRVYGWLSRTFGVTDECTPLEMADSVLRTRFWTETLNVIHVYINVTKTIFGSVLEKIYT